MGSRGGRSHSNNGLNYESFPRDAFSDARKNNAFNFSWVNIADNEIRPQLDAIWDRLSDMEKYAIWQYTRGSGGFNRPLSGYSGDWNTFVGEGKVPLNTENMQSGMLSGVFSRITNSHGVNYERAIYELTDAIQKSSISKDMYLVRGSSVEGLAGMLRDTVGFDTVTQLASSATEAQMQRALVGKVAQSHAFISTAISNDAGFGGSIQYRIYAPAGTKGIYAEPQSYYGMTVGSQEKMYSKGMSYSDVGSEAEMILQRGTKFRVVNVTLGSMNVWHVEMEVVSQPMFKSGRERTK